MIQALDTRPRINRPASLSAAESDGFILQLNPG